jgi:hypothetical protein
MDSISEASGGILNSCFVFLGGCLYVCWFFRGVFVLKSYWCQVYVCKVAIMYLSIVFRQ